MNQEALKHIIRNEFKPKESYKSSYEKVFRKIKSLEFSDPYSSFFERSLFIHFLKTFALQGIIMYEGIKILEYGLELKTEREFLDLISPNSKAILKPDELNTPIQNKNVNFEADGLKFDLYLLVDSICYKNFIIAWIFPEGFNPNFQDMFAIYQFAKNYYFYSDSQLETKSTLNAYPELLYYIRNSINNSPHKDENIQGIISHFYIQDLKAYYNALGEKNTREMLDGIKNEIKTHIKGGDLYYRVSQKSYLTYSPNFNVEQAKKRYEKVFFETHKIIINFKLYFYAVDGPLSGGEEFWEALFPDK